MSKLGLLHVIQSKGSINTASVILLHGSGDTGSGFLNWIKFLVEDFSLPHVKFLFPTAPLRPYTPLDGELSNVWFDRQAITPEVPDHNESLDDINTEIKLLMSQEVNAGIPPNRIIIGGFSMGGALALHTAFRFFPGLAGVFALSSFLNNDSNVYKNPKGIETPLFMCHGDRDSLVPLKWGEETFRKLTKLEVKGEFRIIKNAMHEIKREEIIGLLEWIQKIIPQP